MDYAAPKTRQTHRMRIFIFRRPYTFGFHKGSELE